MSEKRMFSQQIIDGDDYLDLPFSAQSLYFQICMRADDDGLIDCVKKVMRITGCKENDLKKLISSGFLLSLGGSIYAVTHWNIHNTIRSDRRKPSIHLTALSRLSLDESGKYVLSSDGQVTTKCQPDDNQMTTKCQPDDNQVTGTAQPNVRVDIDIDIDKSNKVVGGGNSKLLKGATRPLSEITTADQKKYLNAWNQIPHALKIDAIVPGTQRYDELRICEGMYGRDGIIRAMQKVKDSPYLKRLGSIRFDSYINRNALQKLLEGSYDRDYQQETGTGGAGDGLEWSS